MTIVRKLFSKGQIGTARIKNRMVMTAMTLGYAELSGEASEEMIRYYEERAKGGVGMIVTEIFRVNDEHGKALPRQVSLAGIASQKSLRKLTDVVHKYDTRIFAQLHHGGNTNSPELNGGVIYSASDVPSPSGIIPTPFTTEQIQELIGQFIKAAVLAKMAGLDGVELHGAHGYLISQFMAEHYNHRTDQYGGSFENRMRFPAEIIAGIKSACGGDFPVIVRMNGEEYLEGKQEGTITQAVGKQIAKEMEAAGADALDVSVSSYFSSQTAIEPYSYPAGWRRNITQGIKQSVTIPVIGTNTIKEPEFAEQLLQDDVSDFVGLGRSLLCDPQFANKAGQGRSDEIRKCLGCLYCFESLLGKGASRCAINPVLGRDEYLSSLEPAAEALPVAVVGGGPAGMEAALTLARRGYKVTLYEKEKELGGSLNAADKVADYKNKITKFRDTQKRQLELAGVEVRLGVEATPETVKESAPAGVFLALGADQIVPPLPGISGEHVCLATDVLEGKVIPQGVCTIIGSGLTGLETAEFLLDRGYEVNVVEMQEKIGPGIYPVILMDIMGRLGKAGLYPGHKLTAVEAKQVLTEQTAAQETVAIPADTVILALGVSPHKDLATAYDEVFDRVVVIGDAKAGGRIYQAVRDGYIAGAGFTPLQHG